MNSWWMSFVIDMIYSITIIEYMSVDITDFLTLVSYKK